MNATSKPAPPPAGHLSAVPECPQAPTPNFEAMPAELKDLQQWLLWDYEWVPPARDKLGRWTKEPKRRNRHLASTKDPGSWLTFEEVQQAYGTGKFDGVGFVFTPGDPYLGIDLDDVFVSDADDSIWPWAREILDAAAAENAYIELSPSAKGFHIIGRGEAAKEKRRNGAEMYSEGRYFTMTGKPAC